MRFAAHIGIAYLLLVLLSALWHFFPYPEIRPDVVSLWAAYLGLSAKGRLLPSLLAAVILGYLSDLLFGTPTGLMAVVSGLICLFTHLAHRRFLLKGFFAVLVFSAFIGGFSCFLVMGIRGYAQLLHLGYQAELTKTLWAALGAGLVGPLVFAWCRKIDTRFSRTSRERNAAMAGIF